MKRSTYLTRFFPAVAAAVLACLIIARLLYPANAPEPFSDAWDTISGLGDLENNPVGFFFFQASMVLVAALLFPVGLHVHPRLSKYHEVATSAGTFFLAFAALGFFLTGLLPDGVVPVDKFHEITAGAGALGTLLAAFFYSVSCKKAGGDLSRRVQWAIALAWWVPLVLAGVAYGYAELVVKPAFDLGWYGAEWGEAGVPVVLSFALWERVLFGVLLAYSALLVYLVPE
ncbi:MAG: hypothetical protein Kow0069_04820 [Promethearchaeota archaeon]